MSKINVTFFFRKPFSWHTSIESGFHQIIESLPAHIEPRKYVFRHYSKGIISRLLLTREANRNQGAINHITGDVHFVALGLDPHKTILTIHDCKLLTQFRGIKYFLYKWIWFDWPMRRAFYVTTVSQASKNELLKHINIDPTRIKVIPITVSNAFARADKVFNNAEPRILQIGTAENKNLERVIQALWSTPCHLHIIGKLSDTLKVQLSKFNISFSNSYNLTEKEVYEEYKNCDILSFVSTYEGFGMPIIEAQRVGRAVITSSILSMPEVAGDGACFVDPFNIPSITAGFSSVINDEVYRNVLISNGFINAKRFDPKKTAASFAELYSSIQSRNLRHN